MISIGITLAKSNYYLHRLSDPGLLAQALITESGDLAVPVGGPDSQNKPGYNSRRGGWTDVMSIEEGHLLINRMRQQPDLFPNPRFVYSGQCVAFGAEIPGDDVEAGRYYGYSEDAIQKFMNALTEKESRS